MKDTDHIVHYATEAVSDLSSVVRNSIGGYPILKQNQEWPICPVSGERMVFFLQFDIPTTIGLPFEEGCHLAIFMSPKVNEIHSFDFVPDGKPLPTHFWESREPHFKIYLNRVDEVPEKILELEKHLVYKEMVPSPTSTGIRVGGKPEWIQDPERHVDADGHELSFLCQIEDGYAFRKTPTAPEQPNSFSADDYCLFLGNEIYLWGVPAQMNPESVWIVLQN